MKPITYVILPKFLSPEQAVVQACHSVQCLPFHDETPVIVLHCTDEGQLVKLYNWLHESDQVDSWKCCEIFFEPPLQQYTALAVVFEDKEVVPKAIRKLRLYKAFQENNEQQSEHWTQR